MLQEGGMKVTDSDRKWLLLIYRVPVEPSTLRVKAWRKMKEIGALYLQQSAAICPLLDSLKKELLDFAREIRSAGGEAHLFEVETVSEGDVENLIESFNAQRNKEYEELIEKCGDFFAELKKETERENFTFAELEENEEELGKLLRWFDKIKARDFFGAPLSARAQEILEECRREFADFAQKVYRMEGSM
jgi:vacuolar-type H+-ATPase subunit I/STV1